ncbi:hypothetical protein N7U49_17640 [Streptomyces sp. AD2-2]|nr:hypothetical protein N7U49_17640 [Streptomyces sp. AD2-2]
MSALPNPATTRAPNRSSQLRTSAHTRASGASAAHPKDGPGSCGQGLKSSGSSSSGGGSTVAGFDQYGSRRRRCTAKSAASTVSSRIASTSLRSSGRGHNSSSSSGSSSENHTSVFPRGSKRPSYRDSSEGAGERPWRDSTGRH